MSYTGDLPVCNVCQRPISFGETFCIGPGWTPRHVDCWTGGISDDDDRDELRAELDRAIARGDTYRRRALALSVANRTLLSLWRDEVVDYEDSCDERDNAEALLGAAFLEWRELRRELAAARERSSTTWPGVVMTYQCPFCHEWIPVGVYHCHSTPDIPIDPEAVP